MPDQDQPRSAGRASDQAPPDGRPSIKPVPPAPARKVQPPTGDAAAEDTLPDDSIRTRPPAGLDVHPLIDGPSVPGEPLARGAFPDFEVLGILGKGGMGIVYRARQIVLNRIVALKVVLGGRRAGRRDLIRFLAEAEAVASIKHPHVVQVHNYGEAQGRPYLAMEFLPGGTLADRLKAGRLQPREAAELVAKLARGVQAAHEQEIVHRDLKPGNVLFDERGEPKVADFGLAKRAKGSDQTHTQAIMGTPAYMSPEQAGGKSKFVGPPADVYALGVILYECLTGTRPFDHDDSRVLLVRVRLDDPEPASARPAPGPGTDRAEMPRQGTGRAIPDRRGPRR